MLDLAAPQPKTVLVRSVKIINSFGILTAKENLNLIKKGEIVLIGRRIAKFGKVFTFSPRRLMTVRKAF